MLATLLLLALCAPKEW